MTRHLPSRRSVPRGFTLLELLIVIGVIALLAGILYAAIGTMLTSAKEMATKATIHKIAGLLNDQLTAFERAYDPNSPRFKTLAANFRPGGAYPLTYDDDASKVLAKKAALLRTFPQNLYEAAGFDRKPNSQDDIDVFRDWLNDPGSAGPPARPAASAPSPANSSELLYLAMTQGKVLGATPVDESSFTSSEVGDTDGDGYPEFIDAWGRPLRFYRWPTRLINPFGYQAGQLAQAAGISPTDTTIRTTSNSDAFSPLTPKFWIIIDEEIILVQKLTPSGGGPRFDMCLRGQLNTVAASHSRNATIKLAPFGDLARLLLGNLNSKTMAQDADDTLAALSRREITTGTLTNLADLTSAPFASTDARGDFELIFHTLDSYTTPLIVSAGEDGILGLGEPGPIDTSNLMGASPTSDPSSNLWLPNTPTAINPFRWGALAQPDTKDGTDFTVITNPGSSPLGDNITNHNSGF